MSESIRLLNGTTEATLFANYGFKRSYGEALGGVARAGLGATAVGLGSALGFQPSRDSRGGQILPGVYETHSQSCRWRPTVGA